jgi:hypothetical protein
MFLPSQEGFLHRRGATELLGRHKVSLAAFNRQQIAHHFPCHGQRGPVGIPSLQFPLPDYRQFVALPGRQLGGFHQM